ncbi:MAG: hypothetical protein M3Y54_19620 [Bacteroidota bacterium]|nr:hypothetical protein [Bacteroidota bacterium]
MKLRVLPPLLLVATLLLPAIGRAQAARDLSDYALMLYNQANSPGALERRRKDLVNAPEAYLVAIEQPGMLLLPDERRVRVPAMRYNVALRLLEVRDSTGFHVWPPGSLAGFYLGRGAEARHFRSLKVRTEGQPLDFVEVLTAADNAPLVLAVQHRYIHDEPLLDPVLRTETRPGRTLIAQRVVAGPGSLSEPLRELPLSQRYVGRLFGAHTAAVAAYAEREHLGPTDLAQVLRQVEYYNQLAAPTPAH